MSNEGLTCGNLIGGHGVKDVTSIYILRKLTQKKPYTVPCSR